MTYSSVEKLFKEGNRYFIQIPFNVWEECGKKGLIPVKVFIQDCIFECRLVPKGEGVYYIPVTQNIINKMDSTAEMNISFEVINHLTRINHGNPYTKEKPIRKIDCI